MIKRNSIKIFSIGLLAGTVIVGIFAFSTHQVPQAVDQQNNRVQYQWYPPKTPKSVSFAREKAPLYREDVRDLFEKQLISNAYSHSHTLYILKLSTRVFPTIERLLKANGIPEDFKYMCVAESSLENPTSPAGAKGYWQFMTATAKGYGLEVDREVDQRYNLVKSTLAACHYLKRAHQKLGSWTAAAASYNMGIGGYARRAKFQGSYNYYDLWLPRETNNYIFRILALKEIIAHPRKYGFHVPATDKYHPVPVRKIKVTKSIPNLANFAKAHGTNYRMIRILNPWLRSKSLTISRGNSYLIALPGK